MSYLLRLTLVWVLVFLYDRWALASVRAWGWRRAFLLGGYALGIALPLLTFEWVVSTPVAASLPPYVVAPGGAAAGAVVDTIPATNLAVTDLIGWAWVFGSIVQTVLIVYRLRRHLRPRPQHRHTESYAGYPVVRSSRIRSPYALLGKIFLPTDMDVALERTALLHEAAHLRHGHPRERWLLLLGRIAFWWHPLQWLIERRLTELQEYQADAAVTKHIQPKTYGLQLLRASLRPRVAVGLFSSSIKNRIDMLSQAAPRPRSRVFYLCSLAVLVLALASTTGTLVGQDVPTYTIDNLNEPGAPGMADGARFIETIYGTVRYPKKARKRGQIGFVSASFRVGKDGSISNLAVHDVASSEELPDVADVVIVGYSKNPVAESDRLKFAPGQDDTLTGEVERTLQSLPKLTPATQNGAPVESLIRMNFVFKLEG